MGRLLQAEAPERALWVEEAVMAAFARMRWPGNVRQRANVVRTAVALLDDGGEVITAEEVAGARAGEMAAKAVGSARGVGRW